MPPAPWPSDKQKRFRKFPEAQGRVYVTNRSRQSVPDSWSLLVQTAKRHPVKNSPEIWPHAKLVKFAERYRPARLSSLQKVKKLAFTGSLDVYYFCLFVCLFFHYLLLLSDDE